MNIAIIGVGTRGTALAQILALGGHYVALYDSDTAHLQKTKQRIDQIIDRGVSASKITTETATRAKQAVIPVKSLNQCAEADFIFEAISETIEVKKDLIEKLDRVAARTTIIITTTLTLSPTVIASPAKRFPERIIGVHFFTPLATHRLAEMIPAEQTTQPIIDRTRFLLDQMNKQTITVKDAPGAIVDRLQTVYSGEALRVLGEGDVTAETIDKLMGALDIDPTPLHWIDQVGVEDHLNTTKRLYEATYHDPRFRPHPIQQRMVDAKRLGKKTGQGFFKYEGTKSS